MSITKVPSLELEHVLDSVNTPPQRLIMTMRAPLHTAPSACLKVLISQHLCLFSAALTGLSELICREGSVRGGQKRCLSLWHHRPSKLVSEGKARNGLFGQWSNWQWYFYSDISDIFTSQLVTVNKINTEVQSMTHPVENHQPSHSYDFIWCIKGRLEEALSLSRIWSGYISLFLHGIVLFSIRVMF